MAVTAFDQAHLTASQQAQLQSLTTQFASAQAAGNTALMNELRQQGEAIRNSAGYGTSSDGSTVTWDNTGYTASGSNGNSTANTVFPSYTELANTAQTIAQENNAVSQANAQASWEFNAQEAQKARDWTEYMSNTAHQREVQDLLKAGLNPVLSAGGSGAAVTSGASASGTSASTDTSATSVFGSYLNALMSSATNIASANINAKSAENIAAMNNAMSYRIAHDFPTSDKVLGEVLQGGIDYLKNNSIGAYLNKILDKTSDSGAFSNSAEIYQEKIGLPATSYKVKSEYYSVANELAKGGMSLSDIYQLHPNWFKD